MVLENKLGITDAAELARAEEKISITKAFELLSKEGYHDDIYLLKENSLKLE